MWYKMGEEDPILNWQLQTIIEWYTDWLTSKFSYIQRAI